MSTSVGYIEYVCEQIKGFESVSNKKMFGKYMVCCRGGARSQAAKAEKRKHRLNSVSVIT